MCCCFCGTSASTAITHEHGLCLRGRILLCLQLHLPQLLQLLLLIAAAATVAIASAALGRIGGLRGARGGGGADREIILASYTPSSLEWGQSGGAARVRGGLCEGH